MSDLLFGLFIALVIVAVFVSEIVAWWEGRRKPKDTIDHFEEPRPLSDLTRAAEKLERERREERTRARINLARVEASEELAKLKSYDPDARCPKCGFACVASAHVDPKLYTLPDMERFGEVVYVSATPEHMERTCANCRHSWWERPLDVGTGTTVGGEAA